MSNHRPGTRDIKWLKYNYGTHNRAKEAFKKAGMPEVVVVATYTSTEMVAELAALFRRHIDKAQVFDLTALVPTTASGDLTKFVDNWHSARVRAAQHPGKIFYAQRTEANTPAFCHLFSRAQIDIGVPPTLTDGTYSAVLCCGSQEVTVPARMCVTTAVVIADMLVTLCDIGHHGFKCGECRQSFSRWTRFMGNNVRGVEECLITDCDHLMHPACVAKRVTSGRPDALLCPTCSAQLPVATVPADGPLPAHGMELNTSVPMSRAELASIRGPNDPQQRFLQECNSRYNAAALNNAEGMTCVAVPAREERASTRATPTPDFYPAVQALLQINGIEYGTDEWWCVRAAYRKEGTDGIPKALNMKLETMKRVGHDFKFSERLKQMLCDDPEDMRVEVEALDMQVETLLAAKHRDQAASSRVVG